MLSIVSLEQLIESADGRLKQLREESECLTDSILPALKRIEAVNAVIVQLLDAQLEALEELKQRAEDELDAARDMNTPTHVDTDSA